MKCLSVCLNMAVVFCTAAVIWSYFNREGRWNPETGKKSLRFFTTLSNILCAAGSLLMAVSLLRGRITRPVWMLKYLGTVSVTVTMLTVLFFLGPSMGTWKPLYEGSSLYMHLIGPVLALVSFCFLEEGSLSIRESLWGTAPVILYGLLYLYRILYAPEEKRWDDFYGFNRGGKWPVSFAAMMGAAVLLCLLLRLFHRG